jgi:peptide/nickel transport system substrate-binding protein
LVNWAVQEEPLSVDWTLAYNLSYNQIVTNFTESIITQQPDFSYQPGLAESYRQTSPVTWEFAIRRGVKFHDGSPMTAEDVAFSLSRNLSPDSYWAEWVESVKSYEVTGPFQVTAHLKSPSSMFLEILSTPCGGVGKKADILAKGKSYGTSSGLPLGTGPLKASQWVSGQYITLVRNDAYWNASHGAKATEIKVQFIGDESTMVDALLSGAIDGTYDVPFDQIGRLRGVSAGKLYLGNSLRQSLIFVTEKQSPLLHPQIRLAWLTAIDRVAIAESSFHGAAAPFRNTVIPLEAWGGSAAEAAVRSAYYALAGPEPDVAAAKKLVKSAGGASKEPLVIWVSSNALDQNVGLICQSAAQAIGLNLSLQVHPEADILDLYFDPKARAKTNGWLDTQFYLDIADPMEMFVELLQPLVPGAIAANANYIFDVPAVTAMIVEALEAPTKSKQIQILLGIQKAVQNILPVLPLVTPANPLFMGKRITGATASGACTYYPWGRDVGAS